MPHIALPRIGTDSAWRDAARDLIARRTLPEEITWSRGDAAQDLFAQEPVQSAPTRSAIKVPRDFVTLAGSVVWHRDPQRFARLYAVLWRLRTEKGLMEDRADPALAKLRSMEKAVHRDKHKMTAFVRFREIGDRNLTRRRFAAWFEPTHFTLEPTAPFFARRFADMDWMIATPDLTAAFESGALSFHDGQPKPDLPEDATEELWGTYFRNIFNPARLKIGAMTSEMPKKYWKNLPEARHIPEMIAAAEGRAAQMQAAAPTLPPVRAAKITERLTAPRVQRNMADDLDQLRLEESACTRCPLYGTATQVVPGEGPRDADLMVVGEQPGDQEDLAGRPFVGPAGQLFDRIAKEAGVDRSRAFVTNAVKHFKFAPKGKRRIHQTPNSSEIDACRWWVKSEIEILRPKLILSMGGTAAESLTGSRRGILSRRGTLEATADGVPVFLTVHPSYLLRLPDPVQQEDETEKFRADLVSAQSHLEKLRVG